VVQAREVLTEDLPYTSLPTTKTTTWKQVRDSSLGEVYYDFSSFVVAAIFVRKLVSKTKGKTLEDITNLWKNRKNK
jgi:hypothetical protein